MLDQKYRNQLYGTLCVNIVCMAYGTVCGWPSASFPELLSEEKSPLPSGALDMDQLSWVGSQMCIGSLFGNSFYSWASDRYGRRHALIQSAFPLVIGWGLLLVAQNPYYLYTARFVLGFAGAGAFVVIPIFVSEIADKEVRGSLGSLMTFSCNVGILVSFIVGHFVQYFWRPVVLLAFPIAFLMLIMYFPETPVFLMNNGRYEEEKESRRFYQNMAAASEEEMVDLKHEQKIELEHHEVSKGSRSTVWSEFNTRHGRRAALIGIVMIFAAQLCGCFAMLNYTAEIFSKSGSTMDANLAAIILGVIQLIGAYVATVLVDRAGRKFMLTLSCVGAALGLIAMATCMRLQEFGYDLGAFSWVIMVSFGFMVLLANFGLMTLVFLVITEVMPDRVRSTGTSMTMALLYAVGFVMLKGFPMSVAALGMSGTLYVFAGCSLASATFVVCVVPETKGKSFDEIKAVMEK